MWKWNNRWDEDAVIKVLKQTAYQEGNRATLKNTHGGAYSWIERNDRLDLLDEYLPRKRKPRK